MIVIYRRHNITSPIKKRTRQSNPSIESLDLSKSYGEKVAVSNLNLKIYPGEVFGFLGPNGAGKTTTIRMMCCLLRPTNGTVRILGHDINSKAHINEIKRHIGYLPETPVFYEKLSAREQLEFVAKLYFINKAKREKRIDNLLQLFENIIYI